MTKATRSLKAIKVVGYRGGVGNIDRLVKSIETEGLHRPLVLSPGGTLLSGERRFAALYRMAKPDCDVVYVSDIAVFADTIREDMEDRTGWMSMRPSEMAAQLDTAMNSGLSVPSRESGRLVSVPGLFANAFKVPELAITSILLIYRTASYGLDDEDREWGQDALNAIDGGSGLNPTREALVRKLKEKYKTTSIDYRYIEQRTKSVGSAHPNAIITASEQRHTLTRATEMMESVAGSLKLLGPLDKKIKPAERSALSVRLRTARASISSMITILEGSSE